MADVNVTKRDVFVFANEDGELRRDPIAVVQSLYDGTIDLDAVMPLAESGDVAAQRDAYDAITAAFAIPKYDPDANTGWTVEQAFELYGEFLEYSAELKKKRDSMLSSEPTTQN